MINWFPGHMAKTKKLISENIKLVDVVLELVDARLPASSRNPLLQEFLGEKPLVLVLNKADLAEKEETQKWLGFYRQEGYGAIAFNSLQNKEQNEKKKLYALVKEQAKDELKHRAKRGIKNQVVRLMILGIPNVGKSTLLNNLKGRVAARTGDKPGVTKGKQWVRLENELELLDMPGILWPKIEDPVTGYKLAVTGAIKEEVYDSLELSLWLLGWLGQNKPGRIAQRYQLEEEQEDVDVLEALCRKRGFLARGGEPDLEKGAHILLAEYRSGKLGRVTMDVC
ncbi:MAG: ribosome biogenesis GTPase YlqF [Clostridia bacterium]|nr:ribosome biogenesis GTPase YlqF [Clostridia bacterium]MDD4665639.1 ribosome biogenesis GTPase YlqF [Clostridia bacterium]